MRKDLWVLFTTNKKYLGRIINDQMVEISIGNCNKEIKYVLDQIEFIDFRRDYGIFVN